MIKNTVSAGGGAMSALTRSNLIDEQTGEVKLWVLKGLARREAMQTYGAITPRSLRSALQFYADMLPEMKTAWRERHGLPVEYVTVTAYGKSRDGVRRSAF
jgi:hypothetical protein